MVKKLDDSIGDIVEALGQRKILNNTVIVFIADNGGAATGQNNNYASNLPLRGCKFSAWEGGIRVVGLVWSTNLTSRVWDGYMHIVDWLPTILAAVNGTTPEGINGINLWNSITENNDSQRHEIFEIDDYTGYAAIVSGDYKLIHGLVPSEYNDFYNEDLEGVIGTVPSYSVGVENSKLYRVLENLGRHVDVDAMVLKNETLIACGGKVYDKCYPTAGEE